VSAQRIAILGGGLAGLTAAFEIASHRPDWKITLYQMGWRLGGKCASSRNMDHANRIEEHGIHILFGFYENAFHVFRRVYDANGKNWKDAFEEQSAFSLEEYVGGEWKRWQLEAPPAPGQPGDSLEEGDSSCRAVPEMAGDVLVWIIDQVRQYFSGSTFLKPVGWFFERTATAACDAAQPCVEQSTAAQSKPIEKQLWWLLFGMRIFVGLGRMVWWLVSWVFKDLIDVDKLRRLWIFLEIGSAVGLGLLRGSAGGKSLTDFDDQDLLQWLDSNAAFGRRISKASKTSAPMRMIYEVIFAYDDGDPMKPNLAAGSALRGLLRLLLDRKGAMIYRMREGSSETLVTPFYSALRRNPNVEIKFFRRIDSLELTDDKKNVARIKLTVQAHPKGAKYDPLIHDQAHPREAKDAWPDKPKYDDLQEGEELKGSRELPGGGFDLECPSSSAPTFGNETLEWGSGDNAFDQIVLAIPVGALPSICENLVQAPPPTGEKWRNMLAGVETVPTQAAQLWLSRTAKQMGWDEEVGPALVGAFAQPYGNWADMRGVLPEEKWPREHKPRHVAYLCGPLRNSDLVGCPTPESRRLLVRKSVHEWLMRDGRVLWPGAYDDRGEFKWELLVDPDGAYGAERLAFQYFRANTNPSERYVLSRKGMVSKRLEPDRSGFENLKLAGDWTANGLNVGCVEATVMSGRQAARAVLGLTPQEMPVYGDTD